MISELKEITERTEPVPFRGWILFDEDCSFCRDLAVNFEAIFARRGFHFEPLQQAWVRERLNLTPEQALEEMRVLTADGQVFGGANAVIFLARQLWWAAPLAAVARFAFIQRFLDRSYRWVAAHRTCAINRGATRPLPARTRLFALALLPLLALSAKPFLPPWAFMWLLAFAIFFGCKWLTLGNAIRRSGTVCPFRATAYLFAWPGMDAARFLSRNLAPPLARSTILNGAALAVARIAIGGILVFSVARSALDPLLAGWL